MATEQTLSVNEDCEMSYKWSFRFLFRKQFFQTEALLYNLLRPFPKLEAHQECAVIMDSGPIKLKYTNVKSNIIICFKINIQLNLLLLFTSYAYAV